MAQTKFSCDNSRTVGVRNFKFHKDITQSRQLLNSENGRVTASGSRVIGVQTRNFDLLRAKQTCRDECAMISQEGL